MNQDSIAPECSNHDHAFEALDLEADDVFERAAAMFRAMGDPARLRILAMLGKRSMCVTEITTAMGDQMSTVSQRLKLLRAERLVKPRREGKHVYYELADLHIAELLANGLGHADEPGAV